MIEYTGSFFISDDTHISVQSEFGGLISLPTEQYYYLQLNPPEIYYTSSGIYSYTLKVPSFITTSYNIIFDNDIFRIDTKYCYGVVSYYRYNNQST